jgi:predicted SAM-dependent methyltransferase
MQQFKKKLKLKIKLLLSPQTKIVLGAGNTSFPGWLSLNRDMCDLTLEKDFRFLFKTSSLDNILLEHVVEHLETQDFEKALDIMKKFLRPGGRIRIAVPDKNHPSSYVRELTGINGTEPGADDHKAFYSIDDFKGLALKHGLTLEPLEYFDHSGIFHSRDFNMENGYIIRCSVNYKGRFTNDEKEKEKLFNTLPDALKSQFVEKQISYTSLLADFIRT